MTSDTGMPGAGWHPDPWFSGQHRYWNGRDWTADVFPDGPAGAYGTPQITLRPAGERPAAPPPATRSAVPPTPPIWGYSPPSPTMVFQPWETIESGPAERSRRRPSAWQINALALVVGLLLGFLVVEKAVSGSGHRAAAQTPAPVPTVPTAPASPSPSSSSPVSNDPAASVLQGLVVRQRDVTSPSTVQLLDGGNQVSGQITLDLCNGSYPSEALRSARLQVVEYDRTGVGVLSTEAVLYRHAADAAQAANEVRSVAAHCPDSPVVSPVGEPTVTTHFQPAPDTSWPDVAGVQRLAYAFTTIDGSGVSDQHVAVYLHRGRVLEGVYFPSPSGSQSPVAGQTTIAGIVRIFEQRIAALPSAVVNG